MSEQHGPSYCLECFNYYWTPICNHPPDEVWAERNRIIKLLQKVVIDWRKCDLHNQADIFEYAVALIKGEK